MMTAKRINVLVYAGYGTTNDSVRHCVWTLRRLLSPNYAVSSVISDALVKEPWTATCALLVIPGGADLGYCQSLNGEGNRRIKQFVSRGGAYLGFCAGGYYGSKRCEFEVGRGNMEVVGDRELAFFPDICRGLAYSGFVYHSEAGARAVRLRINEDALSDDQNDLESYFNCYYNGGGVFVDSEKHENREIEVLASYTEPLNVEAGEGSAAIVYCKVGEGGVVLTGPHPEFAPSNLSRQEDVPSYAKMVDILAKDDKQRITFLKACLKKLGLKVSESEQLIPSLSSLHLTAFDCTALYDLANSWKGLVANGDSGSAELLCENDNFNLQRQVVAPKETILAQPEKIRTENNALNVDQARSHDPKADGISDLDKTVKIMIIHEKELPLNKETPFFNHHAYYTNLKLYNQGRQDDVQFGQYLLYGEVITSTSTLLEKNPTLLNSLPNGFTATATTQVAGRGRGSNVWVSPPGSLMFSTVLRVSFAQAETAPVVFIQYLIGLAIIDAIKTYEPSYQRMPIKLKWPNDIYARRQTSVPKSQSFSSPNEGDTNQSGEEEREYVKIGGILVNSTYTGGDYTLVVGVGLNVANEAPTTSLNALAAEAKPALPPFQTEKLLARILVCFQALYTQFCRQGWSRELEGRYYEYWLHGNQIVNLEVEGGSRARIKGITRDWGLLLAEELGWEDRPTGRIWQLQSNSNSFDFFKGLIKQKL